MGDYIIIEGAPVPAEILASEIRNQKETMKVIIKQQDLDVECFVFLGKTYNVIHSILNDNDTYLIGEIDGG